MNEDLKFLIRLVKEASQLIGEDFEVKAKDNKGDLVTSLDYEIEKYLIENIKENYPNFSIVSEEYNSEKELTDNCFTIDPIDGTVNFANNIPLWGIQVACIRNGKTCAAVIYLPKFNELYYADESGAYMNGSPISVNDLGPNKGVYVIEGVNIIDTQVKLEKVIPQCRHYHCASIAFAWVACGRLSATTSICKTLWDYVPGQYLVQQAGGVIYNNNEVHIAANNEAFLEVLKNNLDK